MTSSGETSPVSGTPTGTPGSSQAPKFGTLIPNRVFVGGIAANTQEHELKAFFSQFGAVKDCKIIVDRSGVSKGSYGFVTFETLEDAEKIIKKEGDNLVFNGRKLNIGPAIRKQQTYPRMDLSPGAIYFSNGIPYTYQNGMAIFQTTDYPHIPAQPQPAATYPGLTVQPQTGYLPYVQTSPPAAAPATWTGAATSQWRWTPQSPGAAMGTQPYLYPAAAAVQPAAVPAEMAIYQQAATAHYITPGEMTAELEATAAAAAAAEGSTGMEPNMYADKVQPAPAQIAVQHIVPSLPVVASTSGLTPPTPVTSTTTKTSPILYGKRPGAALAAPPRKMMSTAHCSVLYSPVTPTPPYYKYERAHQVVNTNCRALTLSAMNRSTASHPSGESPVFAINGLNPMFNPTSLIPLTPPQTPDVK